MEAVKQELQRLENENEQLELENARGDHESDDQSIADVMSRSELHEVSNKQLLSLCGHSSIVMSLSRRRIITFEIEFLRMLSRSQRRRMRSMNCCKTLQVLKPSWKTK
jgi:hypothetical protein